MDPNLNSQSTSVFRINGDRLMQRVQAIGAIGALPSGGVRRLAFSPEDVEARRQVCQWMEVAGMDVRLDAAGNIIGRYPGRFPTAPALATGSHLDTVPNAGIYDGTYGVLAGLEVVSTFHDSGIHLDHPIEVIVFADEERTMIGSKGMVGQASLDPEFYAHPQYQPIQLGLHHAGGDWAMLPSVRRQPEELAAFVELHVEQGPVLEAANAQIGLVTGIVGQRRYGITVEGRASHAGTTPMDMRQDALVAAAQIVLAINRIANKSGQGYGEQVATVGALQLSPNAVNTVPGLVEMSLDIRDLSNERLDAMLASLEVEIDAIATATQTRIHLKLQLRNDPVPVNSHIYGAIAQVCEQLSLSTHALPSRASHDAQIIASMTDMGMIFVPSEGGLSHTPLEHTSAESCIQGTNVLLHTLINLDQHYSYLRLEQDTSIHGGVRRSRTPQP